MTTVLSNIRNLEAEYRRGGLSREDFQRTREYLLASVEDAKAETPEVRDTDEALAATELWHVMLFLVLGAIGCFTLSALLLGDMTLAITVTAVLLAAVAVRAAQKFVD